MEFPSRIHKEFLPPISIRTVYASRRKNSFQFTVVASRKVCSCVIRFPSSQPLFVISPSAQEKSGTIRFSIVKLINFNWTLDGTFFTRRGEREAWTGELDRELLTRKDQVCFVIKLKFHYSYRVFLLRHHESFSRISSCGFISC